MSPHQGRSQAHPAGAGQHCVDSVSHRLQTQMLQTFTSIFSHDISDNIGVCRLTKSKRLPVFFKTCKQHMPSQLMTPANLWHSQEVARRSAAHMGMLDNAEHASTEAATAQCPMACRVQRRWRAYLG